MVTLNLYEETTGLFLSFQMKSEYYSTNSQCVTEFDRYNHAAYCVKISYKSKDRKFVKNTVCQHQSHYNKKVLRRLVFTLLMNVSVIKKYYM